MLVTRSRPMRDEGSGMLCVPLLMTRDCTVGTVPERGPPWARASASSTIAPVRRRSCANA